MQIVFDSYLSYLDMQRRERCPGNHYNSVSAQLCSLSDQVLYLVAFFDKHTVD